MAKILTRQENIQTAKQLRRFDRLYRGWQSLFRRASKSLRQEMSIETEFGPVRALGYGFQTAEKAPVFFDLHGGGFVLGGPDMDESINLVFHRRVGCKVLSLDYAKAPEFPYPAAVNQVYAVVSQVAENADRYAIDPGRMAIGGHSAGGNLSTVTCLKAKKAGQFQFVCQLLDYPPLDLATSPLKKPKPRGAISPEMAMMFDACYIAPSQARDPYVSPVYAAQEDLAGLPPALFILAGRDSLHDEGLRYRGLLEAAGVVTECYNYRDAAHGFTYRPSADTADALEKMVAFLKKYLLHA